MNQGSFDHSYNAHMEALKIRSKNDLDNDFVGKSCRNLGNLYLAQNLFEKAIKCYEYAMDNNIGVDVRSSLLDSLGYANFKLKNFGEALRYYEESLNYKKSCDIKKSSQSKTLRSIAMLKAETNVTEAEELLNEALQITISTYSETDFKCIRLLVDKAKLALLVDKGNTTRACSYLQQADEIMYLFHDTKRKNVEKVKAYLEEAWNETGSRPMKKIVEPKLDPNNPTIAV